MDFTINFVTTFSLGIFYAGPVLIFLILLISLLGQRIGKREGWNKVDALYYSFITATTVGYGDFHPKTTVSKFYAIAIAFLGLILTGIVVALAVKAGSVAFKDLYEITLNVKN